MVEEGGVVEDLVNGRCDPMGVQEIGFLEARVVAEVEDDTEVVQEADEGFLADLVVDGVLVAKVAVFPVG